MSLRNEVYLFSETPSMDSTTTSCEQTCPAGPPGPPGNDGTPGAKGEAGKDGEKGDSGVNGLVGAPGANGVDGSKGEKGDVGVGIPGAKGDPCVNDKGGSGNKGQAGNDGPSGDAGNDGFKGDARVKGSHGGSTGIKGVKGKSGGDLIKAEWCNLESQNVLVEKLLSTNKNIIVIKPNDGKTWKENRKTWTQAYSICKSICGNLYFPSSLTENNEVHTFTTTNYGRNFGVIWLRIREEV